MVLLSIAASQLKEDVERGLSVLSMTASLKVNCLLPLSMGALGLRVMDMAVVADADSPRNEMILEACTVLYVYCQFVLCVLLFKALIGA